MFSGLTSFLPWYSAKQATTVSVETDLERGDENRHRIEDGRFSSVPSIRIVDSFSSVNRERDLPNLPQDGFDNGISTSGRGVCPPSEEPVRTEIPEFLATIGRSASTPPEILHVNPPPDSILQLQEQDNFYSATSSSSSASSNHSYALFFHRTCAPKRTRSTRSLGPGGVNGVLGTLSPIYEPSSPGSRDLAAAQKEGEVGEPTAFPKKTLAPSVHSTTSTIQERITNLQSTHPAFLKRSLKGSLSQTSSGSLHSEASGAPQLPLLHFRPAFAGIHTGILTYPSTHSSGPPSAAYSATQPPRVVVPTRPPLSTANSPQRSQLSHSQPNTPRSLTTPRSHRFGPLDHPQKCSAIYEDSGSEKSFMTATSGETDPGPGITTKHDIPSTADFVIYPEDLEQPRKQAKRIEERKRDVQEQPLNSEVMILTAGLPQIGREAAQRSKTFSESETTFNPTSDSQHVHNRPIPTTVQKQNRTGTASAVSIASTTVRTESVMAEDRVADGAKIVAEDEGFIMERWMKTLFYSVSGDKELFSTEKGRDRKQYPVSSTCVLFWVGFIAPWCWLVGGWMPPKDVSFLENKMKHEKLKENVRMDMNGETVSRGEEGAGLKKWIMPNPSSSFKATARAPSISSATALCPTEIEDARLAATDPWVRRCRIASIVGGVVLGLGLIAMVIVIGVVTH